MDCEGTGVGSIMQNLVAQISEGLVSLTTLIIMFSLTRVLGIGVGRHDGRAEAEACGNHTFLGHAKCKGREDILEIQYAISG